MRRQCITRSDAVVPDGEPCSNALFGGNALAQLRTARIAISRRNRGCSLLCVSIGCLEIESFEETLIRASNRFGPYPGRSRSRSMGALLVLFATSTLSTVIPLLAQRLECTRELLQIAWGALAASSFRSSLSPSRRAQSTLFPRAGPHFRTVLGFTLSPRGESELATARLVGELVRASLP